MRGSWLEDRLKIKKVRIYTKKCHLYACSTRFGAHVLLEKHPDSTFKFTQRGGLVLAYAVGRDGDLKAVVGSRNLTTGAVIRRHVEPCAGGYPCRSVYQLIINAKGSVAWIIFTSVAENGATEVWKNDSSGAKMLDYEPPMGCGSPPMSGCDVIGTSYLTASNGQVFWKANGAVKSAPFH